MLAGSDHYYSFWNLPHSASLLRPLCHLTPVAAPPLSEEAGSLLPVGPGVVDGGLVIACWSLAPLHSTLYASSSRPGGDLCGALTLLRLPPTGAAHGSSSNACNTTTSQFRQRWFAPLLLYTLSYNSHGSCAVTFSPISITQPPSPPSLWG